MEHALDELYAQLRTRDGDTRVVLWARDPGAQVAHRVVLSGVVPTLPSELAGE